MGARRSLPQDSVSVTGHIFDLHAGHGAILAPLAPQCKRGQSEATQQFKVSAAIE